MTLYEINKTIFDVLNDGMAIDEETGEILFDEENLDELEMAKEEKVENIALFIKNLDAEAKAIYEEKKALDQRQKRLEKKSERLRGYLQESLGNEKFSTSRCEISFRKSQQVKVDEDIIGVEWCKAKLTPDKTAIKKALKNGEPVVGAILVDNISMSIK